MAAGIYIFSQQPPVNYNRKIILAGQLPAAAGKAQVTVQKTNSTAAAAKSFRELINDPGLSLNAAVINALKIWGKAIPANNQADCNYVDTVGLHCLFDSANWQQVLTLDRPTILEFSLSAEEKRYALLTGIHQGQPVLRFSQDVVLPLNDVLSLWNGYYLILWQPPHPDLIRLTPRQISDAVPWLRQQMDAIDGSHETAKHPLFFDNALKARVMRFQRQHQLTADGVVGRRTIIHLDNATGASDSPHLTSTN
jgi:general secretion pathway protein A